MRWGNWNFFTSIKAKMEKYLREKYLKTLEEHLRGGQNLIQVILGPRQVGKTTAIQHFLKSWTTSRAIYESADLLSPPNVHWIEEHWQRAREMVMRQKDALLVLDEVQKIPRWSEAVKKFHDEDKRSNLPLRTILLGSSALLVQRGLTESLAGRFETIYFPHWSLDECEKAFGWNLDQYLFFGGYPGGANLLLDSDYDEQRWQQYIRESLIETVLNKDILALTPVDKPALFRQVFQLACDHAGKILSYTKMLGQLQDAGNTTTIASYLHLLASAQLVLPLQKYSGSRLRQRASSPKLIILNNALANAVLVRDFKQTLSDKAEWGHLVENGAIAHLFNRGLGSGIEIFYWHEGDIDVDVVLKRGRELIAIEIKSNGKDKGNGIHAFLQKYPNAKSLRIGGDNADLTIEEFLKTQPEDLFI